MPQPLTAEQLAILHQQGTFYVDACPGAGKTHAIVERFLRRPQLVDRRGVALISFTRAAADEVLARTASTPELQLSPNFIGTIDNFINRYIVGPAIVRRSGRRPTFRDAWSTVQDTTIMASASGLEPIEFELDWFTFDELGKPKLNYSRVPWRLHSQVQNLPTWLKYQVVDGVSARWQTLVTAGFIDCAHSRTLLRVELADSNRRALIKKLMRYRFGEAILDEFQDCNQSDLELIGLLIEAGINVVLIGDLEQSIYGFREAEPANIREFLDTVPQSLPLTGNFRSSPAICKAVTSLRSTDKSDQAVGIYRELRTPVYLMHEPNLNNARQRIAPILRNNGLLQEDLIFLAHAAWAAQGAAGSQKPYSGKNRVLMLAQAATQFRSSELNERSKAINKIEQIVRGLVVAGLRDLADADLLDAIG